MELIGKLWRKRHLIRYLPSSIWFNFKHFPFKTARHLPVLLCSASISGKGKYIIEGEIKTGMIKLGFPLISIYRGKGINIENNGTIIFKGKAGIGANAGISVGSYGKLTLGNEFFNSYGLKIICHHEITTDYRVRLGFETFMSDTDLHSMKSEDGKSYTKGFGKIIFGHEIWAGSFCKFYKNTVIPSLCTIASNTLINKKIECEPYSLIYSGGGIKTKKTGYCRDIDDDSIDYLS